MADDKQNNIQPKEPSFNDIKSSEHLEVNPRTRTREEALEMYLKDKKEREKQGF